MVRRLHASAFVTVAASLWLLAGASCPSEPGGLIVPPGAQPLDPSQGVLLIVINDAGVPVEVDLRYELTGVEVRHTVLQLQAGGPDASGVGLPTRADRIILLATTAEDLDGAAPADPAARQVIAEIELLLGRDYVYGDTLTVRIALPPPPPPPQPVPPVANAGLDRLAVSGQIVTLDGSGSQASAGGPVTLTWQQVVGPPVALNDAATATPSLVAPIVATPTLLAFRLTVTEGTLSSTDDVQVLVRPDCNGNSAADEDDISSGHSDDCNADGVPDECQLTENDCNEDGIPDECQLAGNDCNEDGIPDDCQLIKNDCDNNGRPDDCDVDCDRNGIPDECDVSAPDCDENGVPDGCDPQASDVNGFIAALLADEKVYPPPPCHFDANGDGLVNGLDIEPFVRRLLRQAAP